MASPTVEASPTAGNSATSSQLKSLAADQPTNSTTTSASHAQARRPQRKLSVFSHNGFQQLDQLDQASLRQHSQDHQQPQQQQQPQVNNETSREAVGDKPRPARTDALGSTGSSRASSCDEPTIVQSEGMKPPLTLKDPEMSLSSSSTIERDDKRSSDSSSNSSLESLSATTSDQKKIPIPPFESIKTQLKRNSVPDAEFMRQHIDKLISHNEAVMDNCHLVNIRSYNSNTNAASLSQRRQTTIAATKSANTNEQQQKPEAKHQEDLSYAKRTKRWSTTAISSNPVSTFPDMQQIGSSSAQTSPSKQVQSLHSKSSGLERKRSCNISVPSLEPIFQQQRLDLRNTNFSEQYQQLKIVENEIENLSLKRQQQAEAESIFRQQVIQQQQQPLDLAIMKLQQQQRQQQERDIIMTALIESQRQQQIHESQLLNEYLSRMMLNGQSNSTFGTLLPASTLTTSQHQQQLPESPTYRCEACDISFWTQDLLNYHSITQCAARQGPQLAKPLAFNFVGPNNFDSLATQQQQQQQQPQPSISSGSNNHNFLSVPPNALRQPAHSTHRHSHHHSTYQVQSKSASPPHRRRPHDEQEQSAIDERVVVNLMAQSSGDFGHLLGTGSVAENLRLSILKQQLLGSGISGSTLMAHIDEPHNLSTQEPAIQHNQDHIATANQAMPAGSTLLPFKKRKISEPNMRY